MGKIEKILRKNLKISTKRRYIYNSHNVIYVKELNKLDKELSYMANKLTQEIETLRYKSKEYTLSRIIDILDAIERVKKEIKFEKRNLDLIGERKIFHPKRQTLVRIDPLEQMLRAMTSNTSPEQEIPY